MGRVEIVGAENMFNGSADWIICKIQPQCALEHMFGVQSVCLDQLPYTVDTEIYRQYSTAVN